VASTIAAQQFHGARVPISLVLLAGVAIAVDDRRTAIEREHAQASEREAIAAPARERLR
jgi:hypothetical protein